MMKKLLYILSALILGVAVSCTDNTGVYKTPEWDLGTGKDNSTDSSGEDNTDEGSSQKPFYIWVDAAANFPDFATSKDNIRRDLTLAADAGFTDIVVDVRPTSGDILFESSVGDYVEFLGAWVNGSYSKYTREGADWDYLQAFIDIGHELGLKVHAAMNTMVGGNRTSLGQNGMMYRNSSRKSWATVYNLSSGLTDAINAGESPIFFNPANAEVQEYLFQLIRDLAAYKDLDGIILDRCRYADLQTDFSEDSKKQFMEYLGLAAISWPDDCLPAGTTYSTQPDIKPKYYKEWLEWRAKVMHDFVEKAHDVAHEANPGIMFGVYVGGWYSQYYNVGVNWASPKYNTSAYYATWASSKYMDYGFADHCDQMLIGAYAGPGAVYGSSEWTMQGFCTLAKQKIGTACPIVAGGPDVGNWDSSDKYTQAEENEAVVSSVKACYDACDGYFLFDMIHLKQADQWSYVKKGIQLAKGE